MRACAVEEDPVGASSQVRETEEAIDSEVFAFEDPALWAGFHQDTDDATR